MTTDTYSIQVAVDSTSAVTATRNLTAMEQATGRSERALFSLGNMAKAASAALLGIGFKTVISEMASFETKMLQLKSLTDATTQQMKAMEKQARELGATTAFSAQQAAEAQGVLAAAGLKTNEILTATPKVLQLAAAGSLELSRAAEISTETMNGLGLSLKDLGRINDVLAKAAADSSTSVGQIGDAMKTAAPIARLYKISLEEVAAMLEIAAANGLKGAEAGNNLKTIFKALTNDQKDNVEILAKHNLKLKDLSIETIGAAKVLDNLSKAHLSATEATVIYGGDATALGAILANNSEKFKENTKDLEKADGMAKKAADTLNQGLAKAFDSLKGTISEAALQLGDSGLKGALTDVIQQATGVIAIYEGMGDKFAESNNYTKEQYDNLKSVADELKIVAGAAGGIASLTAVIWGANAAMVAFNIATRANPLIMGATVVAAAAGATFAKIADNQSTIDKQIETAEKRIAAMEKYGLPNLIGTAVGFDTEKERTKLTALKQFKEEQLAATKATIDATAKTEKHTEAAKTNTAATADSTDKTKKTSEAKKEAAKAAKDLAEAERYFNEQLNAQVAAAENAGKLFAAQQQTKLAGIEAEKQSIIDKASIEYQHATSYADKARILNESQNATNALLAKEKEIRDALTNQSAETIDAKIAAAQSELDNAGKYNLTLAEQLRLKTQISSLRVDKAIIGETASQQDIKARADAEKKANDDKIAALKAIDDAQTAANEKATAQMAILTANLDAAKEAATGLSEAFGDIGGAIGGLGVAMASYEKSQAAITAGLEQQLFQIQKENEGKGDQVKKDKAISDANQKQSQLQVKSYGDMAAAAQGFFKKGTAGYNALGVATKVFRAFEMAQSAISMVRMIADNGAKVGAYITGLFTQTAANTASVAPNVAADATKATASGTAAVAQASNAPFPIGFATGAAMLAFMLAIGVAMSGSGSSAPTMTGAEYEQKQQDKYSASLKTSVLGKDEYSNSIANSLEALKNNSSADLDYSLGMLRAMEKVATSMDTLVSMTAKQLNIDIGQITSSMKFGTSTSSNSPLGSNDLVNLLVFGLFGGFFTKTSVKTEFAGAGIKFIDQTLGSIVTEGIKGAQTYVDVLVTTTKSNFFGMFKSVKQEIKTKYTALSDEIANSISYTIVSIYNAIAIASKQTGNVGIVDILKGYTVSLGKIPLGKDPAKYEEIFKATINKLGDDLAMLDPRFKDFQRIGEGYLETLTRTSNGIVTAQQKLAAAGIVAIDYTNIKEKQGDVEAELVRDSILATNSLTDVSDIMSNLSGTADELLAALENLNEIKFGLNAIGLGSIDLNQKMINAAGGLSAFNSSINDFIGSILSPEDQLNIKTARVASSLESLGITMPNLGGNAQDSLDYYKNLLQQAAQDTTEAGDRAFVKLLQLANDFASVATETAKLATDELNKTLDEFKAKQSEIAATIKTEQGNIVKSTDLLISVYKKLGEVDLASKEEALRLEREKAVRGLDAESASVVTALNNLTYVINVLNEASAGLKSAYQSVSAMRDSYLNTSGSLTGYLKDLNSTKTDYEKAKELFLETATLAKSDDNQKALNDLKSVSEAFLSASKARSDAEIQAAEDSVNAAKSALLSAQNDLTAAQEAAAAQAQEAQKQALSNQKEALANQISAMKESVNTITAFRDKLLSVSKSLGSYLKELTNESQNYDAAKAEFLRISALAKAGDEQALQDLENTAKDFLSISKTQIDDSTKIFKDAIDTSKAGLKTAYDAVVALRDKFKSIRQSLVDYKLEITGAGTPQGSPESIYRSTKKAFEDAKILADGGNEQALTDLPSIAKSFLDASLKYNATGMDYQADYQSVLGLLDTSIAKVDSQIDILNKQLLAAESADKSLIDLNASALSIDEAIKAYKTALDSESQAASIRYEADKALVIANATQIKANADLQVLQSNTQIEQLNQQIIQSNTQIDQLNQQIGLFTTATKSLASIEDLTLKVKEEEEKLNKALEEQAKIDKEQYEKDKELVKQNVADAIGKAQTQIDIMNLQLAQAVSANANLLDLKSSTDTVWNETAKLAQAVQYYIAADLTKNEFIAANSNLLESIKTSIADSQSAIINANAQAVATAAAQAAEVQRAADAAVQLANANASQAYSDLMAARQANRDADLLAAASIVTVNQNTVLPVKPFANGGMASGLSLVGEQGAELVNFNSPANVTSHSQTAGLFDSIGNAIDDQSVLLKEQIIELKALVNLQSNANVALINEMQGMKEELNTISRKAKLEAAA